jgi:predicted phosphodiesterase
VKRPENGRLSTYCDTAKLEGRGDIVKIVFVTDEHYPFQDERARNLALQIVRDFKPDLRIAGSDGLDFYDISRFDKDPGRMFGLQREIDLWTKGQQEWRSASPKSRVWFLRSNHDDRLQKYLMRHPEMYGLEALKLPNLLGLKALGIEWEYDKGDNANYELVIENRLLITHGELVRKFSGYTAKANIEKEQNQISILAGHTHRGGSHFVQSRLGVMQSHECFCLCDIHPNYIRNPNWQQGLVLATITKNALNVEPIAFFEVGGKIYAQWRDKEYH